VKFVNTAHILHLITIYNKNILHTHFNDSSLSFKNKINLENKSTINGTLIRRLLPNI